MNLLVALSGGGLAIAVVGLLDDRFHLSARIRIAVHVIAAIWAIAWLGGLAPIKVGDSMISFGWGGYVVGVLCIVWALNLFNFMDGIDGIAGSEATFVSSGGALLLLWAGSNDKVIVSALVLGSTSFGFLLLNWPPAKIFMGDVGSGYLGYVIAVLAIASARENPAALFVWLTLGGVFFVDATVTLLRRLIRGERVYEAHRSHAYQWLARRWKSHLRVTISVMLINVFWLLPMAWCCLSFPANAWWITIVALTPVTILAFIAGAGRPESVASSTS
jgi:Fuc2NAc and GlcNAc transferase